MNTISKFKITTPIRKILLEAPDIMSLVDPNDPSDPEDKGVYPVVAPKGTKGDFIVYQRDEYSREYTKMGVNSERCRVYINAISENYDRSKELAYQIDKSLSGFHDDPKMEVKMVDSTEDFEDGKYIQVLLFEIE